MARFGKPATGSWTGGRRERMKCIMSKTVRLGRKLVGEGQPTYIIAEIGINHNGDLNIAKEMIRRAAAAGVDAVKFQKRLPLSSLDSMLVTKSRLGLMLEKIGRAHV